MTEVYHLSVSELRELAEGKTIKLVGHADNVRLCTDAVKEAKLIREDAITSDPVNHPMHYTSHPSGIECIQVTEHMSFCLGNAVKYIWRADKYYSIEPTRKTALARQDA